MHLAADHFMPLVVTLVYLVMENEMVIGIGDYS